LLAKQFKSEPLNVEVNPSSFCGSLVASGAAEGGLTLFDIRHSLLPFNQTRDAERPVEDRL